jgi:HPr kinase/phosphorylase
MAMRKDPSVDVGKLLSHWGGLQRAIVRPRIQKPGLALSGFVKHVYPDRLQVLGLTEIDYILSSSPEQAREGLAAYMARDPCGLVITRGLEPPEVLLEAAHAQGVPILGSSLLTGTFISSPTANLHGVLVDVLGVGLLLIGRSGVGKSEAALDLVLKGHRLVADDLVEVTVRPPDTVWGAATELHQHHMEIRGMGILNITHLFGVAAVRDNKKIEVVVELSDVDEGDYDRLGTEAQVWPILSVDVPLVRIPLRPGRNIASLIEVVARNQLLKYRGHDSAREFQEKVNARIKASLGDLSGSAPEPVAAATSQAIPITEVE